jgi:ribosomal protein L12E/L44/L45/RPP1/RPP2
MEYIYAALLLHKAGQKVDENGVKAVLTAAGVKADESRVKALIAALDGVNIEDAISKHPQQLARQHPQPRKKHPKSTRRKMKRAAWQGSVPCSDNSLFSYLCYPDCQVFVFISCPSWAVLAVLDDDVLPFRHCRILGGEPKRQGEARVRLAYY